MKVIFTPCAQNTIVRPMAQAVCIARGGVPVKYIDTADRKEKVIMPSELQWLDLKAMFDGRWKHLDGLQACRLRRSVQVQVNVNDVKVMINAKTTVQQAMDQFRQKLNESERVVHKSVANRVPSRQNTKD